MPNPDIAAIAAGLTEAQKRALPVETGRSGALRPEPDKLSRAKPPAANAWQPIETAPKDRTIIWAVFRPDIYPNLRPQREDLERWNGVQVPLRHPGINPNDLDSRGVPYDFGWNVAAPVGNGGFPDEWIAGWMPLPAVPWEDE